jgi:hypothetical protein
MKASWVMALVLIGAGTASAQIVSRPIVRPPAAPTAAQPKAKQAPAAPAVPARRAATPAPIDPELALMAQAGFRQRNARIEGMLANALARDVTGQVQRDHEAAMESLRACRTNPCIDLWLKRQEAELSQWAED